MASNDAPDWERVVVTVAATGDVPDAPDWERIAVGPGGGPITVIGSGGASFEGMWGAIGMAGATMDPATAAGGASPVGGTITLMGFTSLITGTISNVWVPLSAGNTYTGTQTWAAIYDFGQALAGHFTQLATSASGSAASVWASSGSNPVPMTSSVSVKQGQVYVIGLLSNAPGLACGGVTYGTFPVLPNSATAPIRCNSSASGTTLPASIAFTSCTRALRLPLVFVS